MSIPVGLHPATVPENDTRVMVSVPYVEGMLRGETLAALDAWGGPYTTWRLNPLNGYDYAMRFLSWWITPGDFMVIEQDMVPRPGLIAEIAACPDTWCSARYHAGGGRYITGLGMAKFTDALKRAHPWAGQNIVTDPRGNGLLVDWTSLNEAVERHLTRLGVTCHIHDTVVEHLHYPVDADAAR